MSDGVWIGLGIAVAALVVLVIAAAASEAIGNRRKQRREDRLAKDAADRQHELELADREVEAWKAALEAPSPSIFQQKRSVPRFVGRSQVLPRDQPKPASDATWQSSETKTTWKVPATDPPVSHGGTHVVPDMPMPTSDDPSPATPPAGKGYGCVTDESAAMPEPTTPTEEKA